MFLQIAEVRTDQIDRVLADIVDAETTWRHATVGRRTGVTERFYADRDVPGRYFAVNEFPSYELAMQNSNLAETSALAERVGALVEVPSFWNLDLLLDMRADEFDGLANAVVRVFASGEVDPTLFTDDVIFDINVPNWRFQVKGRAEAERVLTESVHEGNDVESWRTVTTANGLVLEVVTRGRGEHGGMSRQLCLVGLDRGRVASVVVYCTGSWDRDMEAQHQAEAPMIEPGFV